MRYLLWSVFAVIALPLSEFASAHEAGVSCRPISEPIGGSAPLQSQHVDRVIGNAFDQQLEALQPAIHR